MPGRIRDLARHSGAYGMATIAGGITRVVLVPVIARYLSTEEYGRASVILILVTLLTIVLDLGQSSSLIKFVSESPGESERRKVVSTVLAVSLLITLPAAAILFAVRGGMSAVLLGSSGYGSLVLAGIAGGLGNAFLQIGLSYERALARSSRYVVYTVFKGGLSLVLTLVLIMALRKGALGLLAGLTLPPLAIGAAIYLRRILSFSLHLYRGIAGKVLHFGFPLVPMNLAMWVLAYSDIYLIRRLLPPSVALSEVGLYQYAHEICLVLVLPVTSLNLAWPQFLFSNYGTEGAPGLFARVHRYFSFFITGAAFVLAAFSPWIIRLVGTSAYAGSAGVVPLLAGSLLFYGLSILYSSGLYVAGKTGILAAVVAAASALNVVLNILLIPAAGKEGAAFATLVTNSVMALAMLALSGRYYRIPFSLRPVVSSVAVGAVIIALLRLSSGWVSWGGGAGLALAGAAVFIAAMTALFRMGAGEIAGGARVLRGLMAGRPR
jgi:O-antigen/teichoic acid export membrane protein